MFEKVFINVKSGQRQRASHTYTLYIMIGCAYTICVVFCTNDKIKKVHGCTSLSRLSTALLHLTVGATILYTNFT